MKKFYLVFFFCFSMVSAAQEHPSDNALISKTIENYFYGYIERDGAKLNKAFDTENGTMKVPKQENEIVVGFENANFKEIIPKWGGRAKLSNDEIENCRLEILTMDIEPQGIASAKMKMEVGGKTYIDILSLQKINGSWKITNKIYIEL